VVTVAVDERRIRVLHVDDEPAVADVAAQYLERENDRIDVRTATRDSNSAIPPAP